MVCINVDIKNEQDLVGGMKYRGDRIAVFIYQNMLVFLVHSFKIKKNPSFPEHNDVVTDLKILWKCTLHKFYNIMHRQFFKLVNNKARLRRRVVDRNWNLAWFCSYVIIWVLNLNPLSRFNIKPNVKFYEDKSNSNAINGNSLMFQWGLHCFKWRIWEEKSIK